MDSKKNIIPAIEEQKKDFLKKLAIIQGFGFSIEKIAKEFDTTRETIYRYIGGKKVLMTTYLSFNDLLRDFIITHLEKKKDIYLVKIQEIEALQSEVK